MDRSTEQTAALRERFEQKPDLPVNFLLPDETRGSDHLTPAHWHEHIELLLAVRGTLRVHVQGGWAEAAPGELVAVNAGEIHSIPEKAEDTLYACLIPHKALCSRMGLPVEALTLERLIRDSEAAAVFGSILRELEEKPLYYKTDVQARAVSLLIYLARFHGSPACGQKRSAPSARERMVKEAMTYLQQHFREPVSTGDLCAAMGFEESYVCSSFKAITGVTVLAYLNQLRCEYARDLLRTGELTVAQCAAQSGFRHMSYFTRTYQRYTGQLPSQTARAATP